MAKRLIFKDGGLSSSPTPEGYTFIGSDSGNIITQFGLTISYLNYNNFQGKESGVGNSGTNVNGFGRSAAKNNTGDYVNGIGGYSAMNNQGTYVNGLGVDASYDNTGSNVNGIGESAAKGNSGDHVSAIGREAALNNTGDNVIAIGNGAGTGNTLSGMFIIANAELPSYVDYAAASASISPTGIAGNTYLYHDQSTNSIGAVRL